MRTGVCLTHSVLDAERKITDDGGVKKILFSIGATAVGSLLLIGCDSRTPNPEQLSLLHQQNAQLNKQINAMQALIEQAGEDIPNLAEQIKNKEAEVAEAIKEVDDLNRRESEMKLRVIELQDRLDAFRDSFRRMQDEIARKQ